MFHRLTILEYAGSTAKKHSLWLCRCICGRQTTVSGPQLKSGHTKSCGCLQRDSVRQRETTHGQAGRTTKTAEYRIWANMLSRCRNVNNVGFKLWYGSRGISVCERWLQFENFFADMGKRTSALHTLDRIDNDGNYCPENCRWALPEEQSNNRRNTLFVTYKDKTQCLAEWAKELNVRWSALYYRLYIAKWSVEAALTTPIKSQSLYRAIPLEGQLF